MKQILHLYSNHKWTGPADHALNLVSWLKPREDLNAYFACGRRRKLHNDLYNKTCERQIAYVDGLYLKKHLSWTMIPDIFALRKMVARHRINLIHSHQDNDALTGGLRNRPASPPGSRPC